MVDHNWDPMTMMSYCLSSCNLRSPQIRQKKTKWRISNFLCDWTGSLLQSNGTLCLSVFMKNYWHCIRSTAVYLKTNWQFSYLQNTAENNSVCKWCWPGMTIQRRRHRQQTPSSESRYIRRHWLSQSTAWSAYVLSFQLTTWTQTSPECRPTCQLLQTTEMNNVSTDNSNQPLNNWTPQPETYDNSPRVFLTLSIMNEKCVWPMNSSSMAKETHLAETNV